MPYRDLLGNMFPGTIYLFWFSARFSAGWPWAGSYIVDTPLGLRGIALMCWAEAAGACDRFLGLLMTLSYYLSLDFSETAKARLAPPMLAVIGMLAARKCFRGKVWGVLPAVVGVSLGLLIRPQVVCLFPALLALVVEVSRRSGDPWERSVLAVVGWFSLVVVLTLAGFLPVLRAGIFDDFLRGLRLVAYEAVIATTPGTFVGLLIAELCNFRILSLLIAIPMVAVAVPAAGVRPTVVVWLVALLGVLLYAPVTPWCASIDITPLAVLVDQHRRSYRPDFGLDYPHSLAIPLYLARARDGGYRLPPLLPSRSPLRDVLAALATARAIARTQGASHRYRTSYILPDWKAY